MTGLLQPRFCYLIKGNESPMYTQTFFDGGKLLEKETYDSVHRNLRFTLAKEFNLPPHFFICISQEEYDAKHPEQQLEVS